MTSSLSSFQTCPTGTWGALGYCLPGFVTTVDPYNNSGGGSGSGGGGGDGGLDGYMGRSQPGVVLPSASDPSECSYTDCGGVVSTSCDYDNPPPGGCEVDFTEADTTALREARVHLRTTFTDPVKAAKCAQMLSWLDQVVANGRLRRGVNNDPGVDDHGGMTNNRQTGHIDPWLLNAAYRFGPVNPLAYKALLNTALHEATHLNGYGHPGQSAEPYTSDYFNLLNSGTQTSPQGTEPNSCVHW